MASSRTADPPARPLGLGLTVRRHHNELCVLGELDLATAPRLERVLRSLDVGGRRLFLDLHDVEFVDCSGWRVVVHAAQRRVDQWSGGLEVVDASPQVRRFAALYAQCSTPGSTTLGMPSPGGSR